MPWYLYMIRCKDNSIYIGSTKALLRRITEHKEQGRRCAKYLRGRDPLELIYAIQLPSQTLALKAESQLKRKSKETKEALAAGSVSLHGILKLELHAEPKKRKEKHAQQQS